MIIAVAAVARVRSERGILKTLDGWWSRSASPGTGMGTVRFAQISLGLYFGTIALMATTGSVLADSRWEVLTVSGVGITAASVISEKRRLTNALALIGAGIAWWVSYNEMGRAVAMDDAGINPADLMLVAGIIIHLPVTALALRAQEGVRILIAPMLVAGLATCATFLAIGIIAVVIFTGCNAGNTLLAALLSAAVVISIVVGAATFLVLFAMEIVNRRRNRKGKGQLPARRSDGGGFTTGQRPTAERIVLPGGWTGTGMSGVLVPAPIRTTPGRQSRCRRRSRPGRDAGQFSNQRRIHHISMALIRRNTPNRCQGVGPLCPCPMLALPIGRSGEAACISRVPIGPRRFDVRTITDSSTGAETRRTRNGRRTDN